MDMLVLGRFFFLFFLFFFLKDGNEKGCLRLGDLAYYIVELFTPDLGFWEGGSDWFSTSTLLAIGLLLPGT